MTDLRTIQKSLHHFLQGKPSDVESYVVGKTTDEVKRRLGIYQEAYQLRLEQNVCKQYPVLAAWLGVEKFHTFAGAYDQMFPPRDYAIRHYSKDVPAYFQAKGDSFLYELAMFEWAMNVALDESPDAILLTIQDFQKITPDALLSVTFHFNPALQALRLHYDIARFWLAAKKAMPRTEPDYVADDAFHVYIWRKENLPYFRTVPTLEAELIAAAKQKKNFADLCALAAISLDDKAVDFVAQTILRWLKDGWLAVDDDVG
jgi:hypothetical protein